MARDFFKIFPKKSVIGMIHLAGITEASKIKRALEEVAIFEEEGVHGIIVEDYHGRERDVERTLAALKGRKTGLVVGINVLRDPWLGLSLADSYGAKFVQFDTINSLGVNPEWFKKYRAAYSNIAILGGVRFKYIKPTGKSLEQDIFEGMSRCEAIVTTGEGTGIETPTQKLKDFRRIMGNFPLIVGAGVNDKNVREQMEICDAAIVGSYFKKGNTRAMVQRKKVKYLMDIVRQ